MLGTACSSAHGHFPVAMGKGDGNTHFPPAAVGKLIELRIEMDATFAATTNKSVKGEDGRIGAKGSALWEQLAKKMREFFPEGGTPKVARSQLRWQFLKSKWGDLEKEIRVRVMLYRCPARALTPFLHRNNLSRTRHRDRVLRSEKAS